MAKRKPTKQSETPPPAGRLTPENLKEKVSGKGKSQPSSASAKPGPAASKSASKSKSKSLEIAPIARQALLNSRLPKTPADEVARKSLNKREIDAIRKFAVALAQDGISTDEDTVLICNRITEAPAIPLTELLYDTCKWCEAEIYYDRLMPSPLGMVRVCVPCGIMLLEADKKGRN